MSVTQRLMAPGGFSVKLRTDGDQFPDALAKQVGPFDQLVVTPVRLEPIAGFADADILGSAIYSGVIVGFPQPGEFTGYGTEMLFGTPDGAGPNLEDPVVRAAGTLSQWAGDLFPANGIGVGTITNTGLAAVTGSYQWCTRREAWLSVCRLAGAEYRVRPNMTIDAADPTLLFRSNPTVVVTRKAKGVDGPFQGLEGAMLQLSTDYEQYCTRAVVVGQGSAGNVRTGSTQITSPFTGPDGQPIVMTKFVDSPTETASNAITLAGTVLDEFAAPRRELRLSSRTYTVGRFVQPGDWIYAYDQVGGLSDPANQITYRGDLITPLRLRVYAITWPLEAGMGVYVRRRVGGTVTYIDLTDHVDWESDSTSPGEVAWEVGAASRPADDTSSTGVASLGANPEITARVAASSMQPGGVIGAAQLLTSVGPFGSVADVGLSVTWVADPARRYRITFDGEVNGTVAGDLLVAYITDGANNPVRRKVITVPALVGGAGYSDGSFSRTEVGLSGTVTRKVRLERNAGTGTANLFAAAFSPAQLVVEDIGLA
jgi:hypothetical protein